MALPPILANELLQNNVDIDALEQAHQHAAHTAVRLNPNKPSDAFSAAPTVPWCAQGKYVNDKYSFIADPLWHAGAYYVQEASSMFLQQAIQQHCNLNQALRIIDLCAAPGGKSTLLASMISDDSLLISNEVIASRVSILVENIVRWGNANTWITNSDPSHFAKLTNYADVLVIDAPCSGSGLFRKSHEYINDWRPEHVELCAQRQKRILHDAIPCLKPGGLLVYMTCSLSRAENEVIADEICGRLNMLSLQIKCDPKWSIVETQSDQHKAYGYRFYPHLLQGEGFYLAVFQKQGSTEYDAGVNKKIQANKQLHSQAPPPVLRNPEQYAYLNLGEEFIAIQRDHVADFTQISSKLKLVRKGVLLGSLAKKQFIPAYDLALCHKKEQFHHCIELTLEQALKYLSKTDMHLANYIPGWYCVCYNSLPLGYVKILSNRTNNYFPSHLRIRKDLGI